MPNSTFVSVEWAVRGTMPTSQLSPHGHESVALLTSKIYMLKFAETVFAKIMKRARSPESNKFDHVTAVARVSSCLRWSLQ